jgi:GTP cyclohydrolase II
MERFLDQVEDEELKEELTHSLKAENPHKSFISIINDKELIKKRWDAFDLKEKERYVRSKLDSEQQSDAEGRQANAIEMEQGSSVGESSHNNYTNSARQLSVVLLAQVDLYTQFGTWREYLFYDGQKEIIAIVMGEVEDAEALYCRLHSSCIHGHYFNSIECTCQAEMNKSQEMIQQAGKGIIILLDQEGKGNGHLALLNCIHFKRQGIKQADAYVAAGFQRDARRYQAAAQVIKSLEIKSIALLSSSASKIDALRDFGVEVVKNIEL